MDGQFVRCLMVETGEEKTILQLMEARNLGRGIYPERVRVRKLQKNWKQDRIRLLPGYVFVFADEEIPVWQYQRMEHVLKVLRYDREPSGYLKGRDLEFARTICELDGKLDILKAVDEEGFIRITDELLKRLHGEVISVDRRKRNVKIRVQLMGQPKVITMNYQLLKEDGSPLTSMDEMVQDESDQWLTAFTPDFADEMADRMDAEMEAAEGPEEQEDSGEPEDMAAPAEVKAPEKTGEPEPGNLSAEEADSKTERKSDSEGEQEP